MIYSRNHRQRSETVNFYGQNNEKFVKRFNEPKLQTLVDRRVQLN